MKLLPTVAHFRGQKPVDLLNPRVEDIDFEWIADRLSKIPRFLGGTREPYSVAQHSLWVMDRVTRPAQPYALLHDAAEAFIGDLPRPLIKALDRTAAKVVLRTLRASGTDSIASQALRAIELQINQQIYAAAGIPQFQSPALWDEVRDADDYARDVEHRALVLDERIAGAPTPVSSERAKADFLAALRALCPNARGLGNG